MNNILYIYYRKTIMKNKESDNLSEKYIITRDRSKDHSASNKIFKDGNNEEVYIVEQDGSRYVSSKNEQFLLFDTRQEARDFNKIGGSEHIWHVTIDLNKNKIVKWLKKNP